MNIAIIADDYLPHSTRVAAKMLHELAHSLKEMGHNIVVITPEVFQKEKLKIDDFEDICIWRFKSGQLKISNLVRRAINESLLSVRAWKAIKNKVQSNTFELVIYYSPSIFFGTLVKKIKKTCACSSYLILRDFFPQWTIDAGLIKKGSLKERYFRIFETINYKNANRIGLMSEKNQIVFNTHTKNIYQTEILRNWAKLKPHQKETNTPSLREKLNLQSKTIFFYGGNIGYAQDMANLMQLVKKMQAFPQAHFVFLGQGDEVSLINHLAEEWKLKNFSYLPSVSQEEFKNILCEIDIGLFSLAKHHTIHNFPGKLLGYMVQSIPILGSVNEGNDLMPLVNNTGAGFISVNGEDETLFENAKLLLQNIDLRKQMGHNGYQLLKNEFDVQKIAEQIVESIGKENS